MTSPSVDRERAGALETVAGRLLSRARQDAETRLAAARAEAAATVAQARAQADEILDEARAEGERRAAAEAARMIAQARRQARSDGLAAQRAVYCEVCDAITQRIRSLQHSERYPLIHRELERRARLLLGSAAHVAEAACGGVVARDSGRMIDLSLESIAAEVIDGLDGEAAQLWTP